MTAISPIHFLVVAALIFSSGAIGVLIRRDAVGVFMCIELMLGGVNLTLVTFSRMFNDFAGQILVLAIIAVAATEAAVGLALMIIYFRSKRDVLLKDMNTLKG